jgi:hypothetical protein
LGPDEAQGRLLLAALRHVAGWFEERERRKTGIEKSGVCLVIAWIGEVIQCGQWKIDPQFLSDEPGAKLQQGRVTSAEKPHRLPK